MRMVREPWEPPPCGNAVGIAVLDDHPVRRHAQQVGEDLAEHGGVAHAAILAADQRPHPPVLRPTFRFGGLDPEIGELGKRAAGILDIGRHRTPPAQPARSGRRPAFGEAVPIDPGQPGVQAAEEIVALVARAGRRLPRHVGERDQVAPAQLHPVDPVSRAARSISRSSTRVASARAIPR